MGWGHGYNSAGEEIGYLVEAVCSEPGCDEKIDRGLAYTCGGLQGHDTAGGLPCGGAFCGTHLYYIIREDDEPEAPVHDAVCKRCLERIEAGEEVDG